MSYSYIASPYTHKDPNVRQQRYEEVMAFTYRLLMGGAFVYSPIVHCHDMGMKFNLPTDFDFWQRYNVEMIANSGELIVYMLPGWKESKGVTAEIRYAKSKGIKVTYVKPSQELFLDVKPSAALSSSP